jgi:omega-6 fatty acid desaturase (delta-12 desaturase)
VNYYKNLPKIQKIIYRFLKTRLFLLSVGIGYFGVLQRFSAILFFIRKYFPSSLKFYKDYNMFEIILNDTISNIIISFLLYQMYKNEILCHYLAATLLYTMMGITLFHNQHTFNPAYVTNKEEWKLKDSSIRNSSFIQVPYYLQFFSANVEYHHIHHLNPKIPTYFLKSYHTDFIKRSNEFDNVVKLSLYQCLKNLYLGLYSEKQKKYLTFEEADREIMDEQVEECAQMLKICKETKKLN